MACLALACRGDELASAQERCADLPRAPVVFVHGSGLTSATWREMTDHFVSSGYPRDYLVTVDLIPRDGDNVAAARGPIAKAVQNALRNRDQYLASRGCAGRTFEPRKADLVAHSMGAISARWFANFVSPESVRTVVSIAGANHGTNRLCRRTGAGDKQMCPAFADSQTQSKVQVLLNGTSDSSIDETPYGPGEDGPGVSSVPPSDRAHIVYFSIRLEPDEWIVPAASALLDGAGNGDKSPLEAAAFTQSSPGNFLFTGSISHDELPSHPALVDFVLQLLR